MGVKPGYMTDYQLEKATRATTVNGMARDALRDIARTLGADIFMGDDGKLVILGTNDILRGTTFKLNSQSGLIDVPTMTMKQGVQIKSLLNPMFRPGGTVYVDERDVNKISGFGQAQADKTASDNQSSPNLQPGDTGATPEQEMGIVLTAATAADGYYKIISVTHRGDTRGNPWYSELICIPVDPVRQGGPQITAPQIQR
jgi:hypothetical protein